MKIKKEILLKALETVKPGLASKEMIEQTTSFCFLKGKVLTFNDEISVAVEVPELIIEGAVNATELYGFASKIKSEEVSMEIIGGELILKAGRAKAGLSLHSEVTLPLDEIGEIKKWKKLPTDFKKAVTFAMSSCSTDMSRPVFTNVHINKTLIEATDSYRIAKFELGTKMPVKPFLLPATSCAKVLRMNPIEIAEGNGWIHFRTQSKAIISCRVFNDEFPDVTKWMTVKGLQITFPKTIINILDRAGIFSKRDYAFDETVVLELKKKKLCIKSSSQVGWFEEYSRIDYTGKDLTFSIQPRLLQDILNQGTTATLTDSVLLFEGENWKYLTLLKQ